MNEKTATGYPIANFKQAELLKVHKAGNFIDVRNVKSGKQERLDYDILVICTGFSYPSIIRGEAT